MVKVILPAGWTEGRRSVFEVPAGTLLEVVRRFADEHPDHRRRLLAPSGEPLVYVNYCVDDELVPRHLRAATEVPPGSTVTVMAPMAGG